jgi:hypothetical protein
MWQIIIFIAVAVAGEKNYPLAESIQYPACVVLFCQQNRHLQGYHEIIFPLMSETARPCRSSEN